MLSVETWNKRDPFSFFFFFACGATRKKITYNFILTGNERGENYSRTSLYILLLYSFTHWTSDDRGRNGWWWEKRSGRGTGRWGGDGYVLHTLTTVFTDFISPNVNISSLPCFPIQTQPTSAWTRSQYKWLAQCSPWYQYECHSTQHSCDPLLLLIHHTLSNKTKNNKNVSGFWWGKAT